MDLFLDETQRLNLHFMLGTQRGSVDEIRAWWRLQDRIELSEEERRAVNYRLIQIGEASQPTWDADKTNVRPFEFSTEDTQKVEKMIRDWQPGFAAADRRWLEPLLAQFTEPHEPQKVVNGTGEAAVQPRHRTRDDRVQR